MDAISFVLGVRTAHLRGSLKELLYHNSEGTSALDKWVGGRTGRGMALQARSGIQGRRRAMRRGGGRPGEGVGAGRRRASVFWAEAIEIE